MLRAIALLALAACDAGGATPDWSRMIDQPKVLPYGDVAMRVPPAGTVAYGHAEPEAPPLTRALLDRGRDRYAIACAVCHGAAGDADTVVARAMQRRPPPSLHEARIAALAPEAMYRAITEGYGLMPSYAGLLVPADRWAVVAYVRTLELARRSP